MKDNFLLKKAQQEVFDELSDTDAGKLIKGIYNYVNTGDSGLDGYLKIVFIPIKNEIDKNEETYQKRCEINKKNGAKGGAPKGNTNAKTTKTTENNRTVKKTTKNNMNNHIHNHTHNSLSNNNLDIIKDIIDYLNNKTNSKFKYTTKITKEKIIARLNEGYVLDDFIDVIDKKHKEWVDTEWEKFLCPETLFGTKFEKYLNQKENIKQEKPKFKEEVPSWYGKNIEEDKASEDEIKQLEARLK